MSKSYIGCKNVYVCRKCEVELVTIDRDDGTTPFLTGCVVAGCGGIAQSRMYQVDQEIKPTHEWYRAKGYERFLRQLPQKKHHELGGLFIRKIELREN